MMKKASNNRRANPYFNPNFCGEEEFLATIALARTKNIGPITFLRLHSKYNSPSEILNYVKNLLTKKGDEHLIPKRDDLLKEIKKNKAEGANIISIFDEKYPESLAHIEDPPIIISYKGKIENITNNSVAIVGSRNCSSNAVSLTYKIAKELCEKNYSIVSGLAKGIDSAAHKGAFDADYSGLLSSEFIPTIGVIGGGIDHIYPKENKKLYEEMAERGVIISENPINTAPKAENFPRRNRIISGISKIIIIAEAAFKSGSLITARMAMEQGKEIFAVPGFPLDPRSAGTNNLIKNGANIYTKTSDIIELAEHLGVNKIFPENSYSFEEESINSEILSKNNSNIENFTAENDNDGMQGNINHQEIFINSLSFTPIEIDRVINLTGINAADISSLILENEILGIVQRHPGNKISKVA